VADEHGGLGRDRSGEFQGQARLSHARLAREHHELLASAPRHSPCGVELSPFHLAPHEVDW